MEIRHMTICDEPNGAYFAHVVEEFAQAAGREIGEISPSAIIKTITLSPFALPDHLSGLREVVSLREGGAVLFVSKAIEYSLVTEKQQPALNAALRDSLVAAILDFRSRKVTGGERQRLVDAIRRVA